MSRFLFDVNAMLALLDPMHVHHDAAHQWLEKRSPIQWLTCSLVENGVIRVASQPRYSNCLGSTSRVRGILQQLIRQVRAESCTHEVSLLDDSILLRPEQLAPSRVSDLYLLALAAANKARLATFDRRIPTAAISGGILELIPLPLATKD